MAHVSALGVMCSAGASLRGVLGVSETQGVGLGASGSVWKTIVVRSGRPNGLSNLRS